MDVGSGPKTPASASGAKASNPAAVAAIQRTDKATPAKPAPTELDASRSVTQVEASEAVRLDMSPGAEERAALDASYAGFWVTAFWALRRRADLTSGSPRRRP